MLTVGQKVKHRPTFQRERAQAVVIYIHPAEWFAVLEYLPWKIREAVPLIPKQNRRGRQRS